MDSQFTSFERRPDNNLIIGNTPTGDRVGFETKEQFFGAGGAQDFSNAQVNPNLNIDPSSYTAFSLFKPAQVKLDPQAKIPASAMTNPVTSGDVATLLRQNQDIFKQQLAALQPSPEFTALQSRYNERTNALRDLQTRNLQANVNAEQRLAPLSAIGAEQTAIARNTAYEQLPITNELAALSDQLNAINSQKQQVLQGLQLAADQGRFEVSLAREYENLARQEAAQVKQMVFDAGINARFVNINGAVYDMGEGAKPISTPQEFYQKAGVSTFEEARSRGLLADFQSAASQERSLQREQFGFQKESEMFDRNMAEKQYELELTKLLQIEPNVDKQIVDVNGQKVVVTTDSEGNIINQQTVGSSNSETNSILSRAQSKAKIDSIGSLLNDSTLKRAVGPNSATRGVFGLLGATNFVASIEQMVSDLTVKTLVEAKAQGATFGALNEQEFGALKFSATKINQWAIKDENSKVTGYKAKESEFRAELDKIHNFAKLDYILKGGNPEDIGVKKETNGALTTINNDGSVTELLSPDEAQSRSQSTFNPVGKTSASKGISVKRVADAIGQFESGGNYKALGPKTSSGDRAYGKYQVMGANIPSWTKAALGRSLTPQQYLNDPKAQDAVAQLKMGEYLKKYGTVENVATAWFAGPGAVGKNSKAKDVVGTSVPKYIQNIRAIYDRIG